MSDNQISVIVPYYRTKQDQVNQCINSILAQSYSNYEVIVVDDGSGESYRHILQEIEELDSRVKVIYKTDNEGLSAARNFGLKQSCGEYVIFVDSDDVIHSSTLLNMVKALDSTGAEMVIGELAVIRDYSQANKVQNDNTDYEIMDRKTAIDRLLCNDGFGSTACGRLAKRDVWNRRGKEPFIKGILHEDLASMWEILNNCSKICFLKGEYYYYFQGGESDIHSKIVSKKFCYDFFEGLKSRNESLNSLYPELHSSVAYSYLTNIPLIYNYSFETENPDELNQFRDVLMQQFKRCFRSGISSSYIKIKNKLRYFLFLVAPRTYIWIYKKVRIKKGLRI